MRKVGYRLSKPSLRFALGLVCAVLALDHAAAQSPTAKPELPEKKAAPPATAPKPATSAPKPAASAQSQVASPDAEKILLLVRSTLSTLNDALQTGNFTVLRDMGAPGFREANTAGRLAYTFAKLAAQGVDLSAVTVLAPQLTEVPTVEPQHQMLHVKGYFPGQPLQIEFEMLYQPVAGRWRLFGLAVSAVPPAPAAAGAASPPADDRPAPAKQAK